MRADSSRTLNSQPLSVEVTEDPESKTIDISAIFSDNDIHPYPVMGASNTPEGHPHKKQDYAYFDYSVDLNRDEIASKTEVSIEGTILGIGGDLKNRYQAASQFITGLNKNLYATGTGSNANVSFIGLTGFLYEKAKGEYDTFFTSSENYTLNQQVKSLTISPNEFNGTISVSASFDDTDQFLANYNMFDSASYSVQVNPALPSVSTKPIVSSSSTDQFFYDLGFQRKNRVSISCSFQAEKNAFYDREDLLNVAKKDAYNLRKALKEKYVDQEVKATVGKETDNASFIKIESDNIDYSIQKGEFSLSSSYSFNGEKNYFQKKPSQFKKDSNGQLAEDPLTNNGLD